MVASSSLPFAGRLCKRSACFAQKRSTSLSPHGGTPTTPGGRAGWLCVIEGCSPASWIAALWRLPQLECTARVVAHGDQSAWPKALTVPLGSAKNVCSTIGFENVTLMRRLMLRAGCQTASRTQPTHTAGLDISVTDSSRARAVPTGSARGWRGKGGSRREHTGCSRKTLLKMVSASA